jgi:uncharacterized membrane protein
MFNVRFLFFEKLIDYNLVSLNWELEMLYVYFSKLLFDIVLGWNIFYCYYLIVIVSKLSSLPIWIDSY